MNQEEIFSKFYLLIHINTLFLENLLILTLMKNYGIKIRLMNIYHFQPIKKMELYFLEICKDMLIVIQ